MRRRSLCISFGIIAIGLFAAGQGIQAQERTDKNLVPITLENVGQLEQVDSLHGDGTSVTCVGFSKAADYIAYGTISGYTFLWAFRESNLSKLRYDAGSITDVAFGQNLDYLASAQYFSHALVWTINPPEFYTFYGGGLTVLAVTFSPDGYTLTFGGESPARVSPLEVVPGGGLITLIRLDIDDIDSPEAIRRISENSGQINSIVYSLDGSEIAAGIGGGGSIEEGGRVKIWDLETLAEVAVLEGHTGAVWDVKYDPTGQFIASASADSTVRLWDTTTGKTIMTFKGHTGEVNAVAFSPDGTLLVSAGSDGTLRFWNVATGEQIHMIDLTTGDAENPVWDVDFSADGTMIATASEDGFVRIWGIPEK